MISGASLAHWVEGCNAVAEFCLRISPELFAGCLTAFLSTGSGSGLQQVSYQRLVDRFLDPPIHTDH